MGASNHLSIRTLLVGTDLTEASDTAVETAGALAAAAGARLHVLHALELDRPDAAADGPPPSTFQGRMDEVRQALDEQIDRLVPGTVDVAGRDVVIYVAHRAIVEKAEGVDADLVIMGPHGPRPVADRILGSTAERVLRPPEPGTS